MAKIFEAGLPPAPMPLSFDPPEQQFSDAIINAGLLAPDHISIDGQIHRFSTNGKKSDKSGWYVFYDGDVPAGIFGDWRSGLEVNVRANTGRKMTVAEELANTNRIKQAKALRDAEIQKTHEVIANTVEQIWESAQEATVDHPYIKRKGIEPHGARVTGDGRLIVPLFDIENNLSSLQYISSDGGKLYHASGSTSGKFCMIGSLDQPGIIYIAEGFATAATIHQATNRPCIAAYSASNLVPVTEQIRQKYGIGQEIVIVADNDVSGTGQKYADQAAAKYGAKVIIPPVEGDANDYLQAGHDLVALLMPSPGSQIIEKLDAVFADELPSEYEPPDEIIENLFIRRSLTVIYGDSNSGKTFFALSLAAAMAANMPAYGRQVEHGLVIYLATESPVSVINRVQALKKYYGIGLENLVIVQTPINFYDKDGDAHDVIELVKIAEEKRGIKCVAIFGDTLARMSSGANENSGEDMSPVMARFDQVAKATNSAVNVIHHAGKNAAAGARGWSGIRAHVDTEIEVTEVDGVRCAKITKQRELNSKGEDIYFKLVVIEMGITKFGNIATTCVAIADEEGAELAQENSDKKGKKSKPIDEQKRKFENAWFACGKEEREGKCYITKSALKDYLISIGNGVKAKTIENQLTPNYEHGLICILTKGGIIEVYEHGFRVIDDALNNILQLRKNGLG
jgi:phage/plasmid primase-like uncharacterized protein